MSEVSLSPMEQRVLGALLEKQVTVPASYPLSVNGLRTACNQTNSREPVTAYDEPELEECLRGLKDRELVRFVWAGKGSRTLKYHQRLEEHLALADDERALVTVLLLRGPQSAGELRTRTERLHHFADKDETTACLERLAARPEPLVRVLERRPGQQDPRWIHLLGPVEADEPGPAAAAGAVDRESVLAEGAQERDRRVVATYEGLVAPRLAGARSETGTPDHAHTETGTPDHAHTETGTPDHARSETGTPDHAAEPLPSFDRWLLTRVAERAEGPVVDVGCGTGAATAVLAEAGARVVGLDLAPGVVEAARRAHPGLDIEVGDLARLLRPQAAAAWGAVVARHSLLHLAASELPPVVAGFARVLAPRGWLAILLPLVDAPTRLEASGTPGLGVDVVPHDPDAVRAILREAGFDVTEWYVRGPLLGEDSPTLAVLARLG